MKITKKDREKLFKSIRYKLGAPIIDVELVDEQLDSFLEDSLEEISAFLNDWLIKQQWSSISGKDMIKSDIIFALTTKELDWERSFTYAYSKQVGLNEQGQYELKVDYITVEPNKQIYNLPAGREINEVMWSGNIGDIEKGSRWNQGGNNFVSSEYGWAYNNRGLNSTLPLYSLLSFGQHSKMQDRFYNSDMFYKITGGPNGSKNLHLYPIPFGRNQSSRTLNDCVGYKVFYWYYEPNDREDCVDKNDDIVRLPSDAKLENIGYEKLSDSFKNKIKRLMVAKCKQVLGNVRGKWSGTVNFDDAERTMDYRMMLDEGEREETRLYVDLKEYMLKFEYVNIMEERANIAENLNRVMQYVPMKAPIKFM